MTQTATQDSLWRGMVCPDIAITFAEDRTRIGLRPAVDRLRDTLMHNDLWEAIVKELLPCVLADEISPQAVAEPICSMQRMRLPHGAMH